VSAIPLAASILGLKVIENLVVQATVLDQLRIGTSVEGFDVGRLWDHSFRTAVAARLLAKWSSFDFGIDADSAYTCGLVHDVGKILLLTSQPNKFAAALRASRDRSVPLAKMEQELFGFSHAQVGGMLAARWRLAPELQAAVLEHHNEGAPTGWRRGFLVHAANTLAHQATAQASGWIGDLANEETLGALLLAPAQLDEIRGEIATVSMGE
jgi:putative nucleotidyltransferase with HDIG domain